MTTWADTNKVRVSVSLQSSGGGRRRYRLPKPYCAVGAGTSGFKKRSGSNDSGFGPKIDSSRKIPLNPSLD